MLLLYMNNIVLLDGEQEYSAPKINLDELYEYKKQCDKNTLHSYNIVLNRIHTRIKMTSRQKKNEQFCWFLIPEVMIGVPKYDVSSCIAYVIDKLKDKIKIISISKSVDASKSDIRLTKLKINEYIREIDKCIAQLNN